MARDAAVQSDPARNPQFNRARRKLDLGTVVYNGFVIYLWSGRVMRETPDGKRRRATATEIYQLRETVRSERDRVLRCLDRACEDSESWLRLDYASPLPAGLRR